MFFLQANQKRLLNSFNPLVMVGFVFVLILVRTTGDAVVPKIFRSWDILLPFVVYLGQRRSLPEGLILTLFAGHLYSLSSAAPIGLFAIHYLVIFIIARLLSYVTYVSRWYAVVVLLFALGFIAHFSLAFIATFFGHGWSVFRGFGEALGKVFLNSVFGLFVYTALDLLDKLTFKAARMNIELSEGEL